MGIKKVIIYHNPRCSKSRQSLQLLKENNVDIDIVEYLKYPLNFNELKIISKKLKLAPSEFIRKNESEFKKLKIKTKLTDDDAILKYIVSHPKLMERPIIVSNEKAVIGRPPERIKEIL